MSLIEKAADDGIFCTMLGTNDLLLTLQPDAARPIRKMEAYLHFLKQYLRSEQIIVIAPPLIGSDTIQDAFYQRCFRESRKMNDGFLLLAEKTGVIFVVIFMGDWCFFRSCPFFKGRTPKICIKNNGAN